MALSAWFTGSLLTNIRDARLYLSEWRAVLDKLEELWGVLGPLPDGTTLTEVLDGIATSQAQGAGTQMRNLRIVPEVGEETHQIHITADGLGIEDVFVASVDLVVDIAAAGALGLDTGTEAIDTWYAVWVGYTPDGGGGLTAILSTSFTKGGLTLGGGLAAYTKWRRVGARRNDHVGNLIPATQQAGRVLYDARYDTLHSHATTPGLKALSGGTATTKTAIDLSPLVPPLGTVPVDVGTQFSGGTSAFLYHGNTVLDGTTAGPIVINSGVTTSEHSTVTDDDQAIYYKVAGGGATIDLEVIGYEDFA